MDDRPGGGEQPRCPPRNYDAAWLEAPSLTLSSPPGEGWTAHVALQLRMADGMRTRWTVEVPVDAETTTEHAVALPEWVALRGLGLLVAGVWFESVEGRRTEFQGLAGRFVDVTAVGFQPTQERFSAVMGIGLIADPHDEMEIDEERNERGEVVR